MGADSKIEWCHHTFNPWWGCVRVSPGCEHCYAEAFAKRVGLIVWGVKSERRFFGDAHWNEPMKWNKAAELAGERRRVFCASMADVFEDRAELVEHRLRLWDTICQTPHLDWLLLTKRPENIARMLPMYWGDVGWPNVWLGTTAEDQRWANIRLPILARVPAVVRFASFEPLLGLIRLASVPGIDWAIIGGESGGGARSFDLLWARDLVEQCSSRGISCFVKQLGAKPWDDHATWDGPREPHRLRLVDRKGGDITEWPQELRVREFPDSRKR